MLFPELLGLLPSLLGFIVILIPAISIARIFFKNLCGKNESERRDELAQKDFMDLAKTKNVPCFSPGSKKNHGATISKQTSASICDDPNDWLARERKRELLHDSVDISDARRLKNEHEIAHSRSKNHI